MPYRLPSPPPDPSPTPWAHRLGAVLEPALAFSMFALAVLWGAELGGLAWGFVRALQVVTPSGHGLAQAFGP